MCAYIVNTWLKNTKPVTTSLVWSLIGAYNSLLSADFVFSFYCSSVFLVRHKTNRQRFALKKMNKQHLVHKNQASIKWSILSTHLDKELAVRWLRNSCSCRNECILLNTRFKVHLRAKLFFLFRKIDINHYLKLKTKLKSFNPVKFYRVLKFEKRGRLWRLCAKTDDFVIEKESDTNWAVTYTEWDTVWGSQCLHCNL